MQIFANIMVPIAIIVAAFGLYLDDVQRGQDAASRQIELLNSEGLSASQVTLSNLWHGQDMSVLENAVPKRLVVEFVTRRIEASKIDRNEITSAIVSIASYFDRVETVLRQIVAMRKSLYPRSVNTAATFTDFTRAR
ncbi:hypothetical protein [uncultured Sulfitobacter sp.]|uniref:hypothetical protein n=1 Tax=uncultured Sulfitobacter sp. TaxID=191468 RepID=UPI00261EC16C|nr:hypothetical protein [uncultured Sulfitobacter sp.]